MRPQPIVSVLLSVWLVSACHQTAGHVSNPRVPPPNATLPAARNHIDGTRYTDEELGITADVPAGWIKTLNRSEFSLIVAPSPTSSGVFGRLKLSIGHQDMISHLDIGFRTLFAFVAVTPAFDGPTLDSEQKTSAFERDAHERVWHFAASSSHLKIVLVPECPNREPSPNSSSLMFFATVWSDPWDEKALNSWIASFREKSRFPYCGN